VTVQIRLVEEFLRSNPDFDRHPTAGIVLSAHPGEGRVRGGETGGATGKDAGKDAGKGAGKGAGKDAGRDASGTNERDGFLASFQRALTEELGCPAEMRRTRHGGVWIRLDNVPQGEMWLFFPSLVPHRPRVDLWNWGMTASCLVVLVGGMLLLWGVHKPLRRLEHAISQVGRSEAPEVTVSGPREVRNLAEQFNRMVARLRQYDHDRAEMLAGVAHDLRTPSTRLRLQLAMEESPRRPAMLGNLDSIDAIVDQFLAFARGAEAEVRVLVDLVSFVDEAVAPYGARGVVFDATLAPAIEISVMPTLLRRALVNLLENALEYGAVPVTVDIGQDAEGVTLRVRDRGPGIPAEHLDGATQAFTRLDSSRGGKGHCGLGLAIVARVAVLHGGALHLANADGGGLAASIVLPLAATRA
jgi:two-component system, OmpR family, osmolarity sensor histidine kinase EnvZ